MQLDTLSDPRSAEISASSAAAIYQAWLDELATAVWERAYETIANAMVYPGKMIAEDAEIEFQNPEEMIEAARAFRDNLMHLRADAYHRICVDAQLVGPDAMRIDGTHVTYILSGGRYVVEPFMNEMTLLWRDARWLGGGLRAAVRNSTFLLLAPTQLTEKLAEQKRK